MIKQERLAREWAEKIKSAPEMCAPVVVAAAEHILATTAPLTMADVDWNDEKHYLAGATTLDGEEVVMMWPELSDRDYIGTAQGTWSRNQLTPNGKRYELREVGEPEQPEHPKMLVTEQDYANAPVGTVIENIDGYVAVREASGWYIAGFKEGHSSEYMFNLGEGEVIRWGLGK